MDHVFIITLVIGLTLTSSVALGLGSFTIEDDAGSGGDAGDERGDATPLEGEGPWNGTLVPLDADWFASDVKTDELVCHRASASGNVVANVTLTPRPDNGITRTMGVTRLLVPGSSVNLAYASPSTDVVDLAVTPAGRIGAGTYTFHVHTTPWSGLQVGPTSDSQPVPGPCFGGTLAPSQGDATDTWTFTIGEAKRLTLSLVSLVAAEATVISPSGDNVLVITGDDDGTVVLDDAGEWRLQVTADQADAYALGFVADEPPPSNPCRPACALQ